MAPTAQAAAAQLLRCLLLPSFYLVPRPQHQLKEVTGRRAAPCSDLSPTDLHLAPAVHESGAETGRRGGWGERPENHCVTDHRAMTVR